MRINLLGFLFFPLFAFAGISHEAGGGVQPVAIGGGIRLAVTNYDPTALAYFLAAGVTDATAKRQISDFIRGMKALGLWSSVTEVWTLRSAQNAGTGSMAYGLKGAYNGTLANGPTWGVNGITFIATSSQRITTSAPVAAARGTKALLAAYIGSGTNASINPVGSGLGDVNYSAFSISIRTSDTRADYWFDAVALSGAGSDMSPHLTTISYDGTNGYIYRDASESNSAAKANLVTSSGAVVTIAGQSTGWYYQGTVSLVIAFDAHVSQTQHNAIRALYKSTIGQGLGLP